MIHTLLVGLTKAQEWALTDDEATQVGQMTANVARHYDWLQGTEKVQDWANLVMCLVIVYGGRMKVIGDRRKAERAATRQGLPAGIAVSQNPDEHDPRIIPGVGRMQGGGLN